MIFVIAALAVAEPPASHAASTADDVAVTKAVHRFSECIVKWRQKDVVALLKTEPNSPEEMQALAKAARTDTDCRQLSSVGGLKITTQLLAGTVIEAYYHKELSKDLVQIESVEELPLRQFSVQPSEPPPAWTRVRHFGWCVSYRDPVGVGALLDTKPLSEEEGGAIARLSQTMKWCRAAFDVSEISRQELRGGAAEGLVNRILGRDGAANAEVRTH